MALLPATVEMEALPHEVRQYKFVKHIQSGAFGCVWHAQTPAGAHVAVKVQTRHTHMIGHEASVLEAVKAAAQEHLVTPVLAAHADGCSVLVTELCDSDLLQVIASSRRVSLCRAVRIFRQLLQAVKHLHSHDVYHCDLKPENVLVGAGDKVRLADFGASARGRTFTSRNLGSPQYLCPELFSWKEGDTVGMAQSDVWSLGVIFFTMLAGYQPWSRPMVSDIQFSHFVAGTMRYPAHFSPAAIKFISSMLRMHPEERASVDQLLASKLMADGLGGVMDETAARLAEQERRVVVLDLPVPATAPAVATTATACATATRCASQDSKESRASSTATLPSPKARYLRMEFDDSDDEEDGPFAVSPKVSVRQGTDGQLCFSVHSASDSDDVDMA